MLKIPFVIDRPYGRVEIVLEVVDEGPARICGIFNAEGGVNLPPARRWAAVRKHLRKIECIAKAAGCTEMRLAGRKGWARVLKDYQPFDGVTNGLRKAL